MLRGPLDFRQRGRSNLLEFLPSSTESFKISAGDFFSHSLRPDLRGEHLSASLRFVHYFLKEFLLSSRRERTGTFIAVCGASTLVTRSISSTVFRRLFFALFSNQPTGDSHRPLRGVETTNSRPHVNALRIYFSFPSVNSAPKSFRLR